MKRTRRRSTGATMTLLVLGFVTACGTSGGQAPPATEQPATETPRAVVTVPAGEAPGGQRGYVNVLPGGPDVDPSVLAEILQDLGSQLPYSYTDTVMDAPDAIPYADTVAAEVPDARDLFGSVDSLAECFQQEGYVAARAFVDPELERAAVMVIATDAPVPKMPPGMSRYCLTPSVPSPAPEGMCQQRYTYERKVGDDFRICRVSVVGTDTDYCTELCEEHNLGPFDITEPL